jgi:hypothetical protein
MALSEPAVRHKGLESYQEIRENNALNNRFNNQFIILLYTRAGEAIARLPKMTRGKISLACDMHCCSNFCRSLFISLFFLSSSSSSSPDQCLYLLKYMLRGGIQNIPD